VSLVTNAMVLMDWCIFVYLVAEPALVAELLHAGPWSIFHTIDLLNEFNMTGLVVLLYGFSICFPFIKLLWITWLLAWPTTQATRSCQVKWLGQLGRWSLLDIYVVLILLMTLTDEQNLSAHMPLPGLPDVTVDVPLPVNITTQVGVGMVLFPLAILCSIAAVAILEMAVDPITPTAHEAGPPTVLCTRAPLSGLVCVGASVLGILSTFFAFFSNLFTVVGLSPNVLHMEEHSILTDILRRNTWSVWSAMLALFDDQGDAAPTMAFFMLLLILFNVVAPCCLFGSLLWLQCVPRDHVSEASFRLACFISTLCLPEVFFFAYVVNLIAINPELIEVDTHGAFVALCAYMVLVPTALISGGYSMRAPLAGAKPLK